MKNSFSNEVEGVCKEDTQIPIDLGRKVFDKGKSKHKDLQVGISIPGRLLGKEGGQSRAR